MLSQFSPKEGKSCLADFFKVPKDAYPVGRLDYDSEGLLILTNDRELNHRLLHPRFAHEREYWVEVEGDITGTALDHLKTGLDIKVDGKPFHTRPCIARRFSVKPSVPDRNPPVRFRKNIPTSWISMILTEGKNRQVRKMTAGCGFPTLRLIRYRVEALTISGMVPGTMRMLERRDIYQKLFSNDPVVYRRRSSP